MKKLFTFIFALHLMILPVSNAHAIGGMGQIVGVGVAAVGVGLVGACKLKTPGVLIYMAGAAAYLMGEMAAAKAQKAKLKEQEDETKRLQASGTKGGEVQLESLKAQLKSKEEELALAKKRSMWAMAASVAFIAAAAVSAMEIPPFFPPLACEPASGMAISMPIGAAVVGAYSFMGGGGIMGALLGAVGGAVASSAAVTTAFNVGPTRSIAMGAMAALVTLSAMEANSAAGKIQKDIADLKKVIAQFQSETDGKGPNTEDVNDGLTAGSTSGELAGTTSGVSSGAAAGAGSGVTLLPTGVVITQSPSCLSSAQKISNDCSKPMTFGTPDLKFMGDQPILQQAATQSAEFANASSRGDIGKADVSAASLAGMAARVNDVLKKSREATNKNLVAQGKKPIDYDKQTQDMLKSMQSSYQKETAGKSAELAALGLDKINLDPASVDKSGLNVSIASTDAALALPNTNGDGAAIAAAAELAAADAAAAAAAAAKKAAGESAKDALGKNLADYESNDNDISASKEVPIWKQVSNRYLLKYERFFDRKSVPEKPAPAAQPAQ